jgi:hypothetical protein
MTLTQINERLTLWPEWLKYFLNEKYKYHPHLDIVVPIHSPEYIMAMYHQIGWTFVNSDGFNLPLSFDQWLYKHGHEDLISPLLQRCIR